MKIGYTSRMTAEEEQQLAAYGVDKIVYRDLAKTELEAFKLFVENNQAETIVLVKLSSIGEALTIVQLLDSFTRLQQENKTLHVIDQGMAEPLTDQQFLSCVIAIAKSNKAAIIKRTILGQEKAKKEGRQGGRPKISDETIERIQYLYYSKHRSLKEISAECQVGLATAYKYVNLALTEDFHVQPEETN